MADKDKSKIDLGLLEEDDEFEEFPAEGNKSIYSIGILENTISLVPEWADSKDGEDDVNVWEDNWDDDNVEDDFNQQLRAQLEATKNEKK